MFNNSLGRILFAPDKGQDVPGSGKTTQDKTAGDQTGKEPSGNSPQDKGDGQPQTSGGKDQATVPKADYDALLSTHNEMKAKADKKAAEEEKARNDALEEQGKFKELYEKNDTELEAIKPKLEKYENALKTFLESQIKDLPENLKAIMPEGDPADQLDWISKAITAGVIESKKTSGDGSPKGGGDPKGGLESEIFDE